MGLYTVRKRHLASYIVPNFVQLEEDCFFLKDLVKLKPQNKNLYNLKFILIFFVKQI